MTYFSIFFLEFTKIIMVIIMDNEKYEYKTSELNVVGNKKINSYCNEYGVNLGSSRKKQKDIFDNAFKVKRIKNEEI